MVEAATVLSNERRQTRSSPKPKTSQQQPPSPSITTTAPSTPSLPSQPSAIDSLNRAAPVMPLASTLSATLTGPATRTRTQRAKQPPSGPSISTSPNPKHANLSTSKTGVTHLAPPPTSRQRSHKAKNDVLSDSQAEGGSGPDSGVGSGSGRSTPKARPSRAPKRLAGVATAGSRGVAAQTDPSMPEDVFQATHPGSAGLSTIDLSSPTIVPGMIDLSRLRTGTPDQSAAPKKARRPRQHARTKSEPMVSMVAATGVVGGGATIAVGVDHGQVEGEGSRPRRSKIPAEAKAGARNKRSKAPRDGADEVVEGMQGLRIGGRGKGKSRAKAIDFTSPEKPEVEGQRERRDEDDEDEDDEDEVDEILIGSFGGSGMEVDMEEDSEAQQKGIAYNRPSTSTPRRKSKGKNSPGAADTAPHSHEDTTTGESSAGETAMPIPNSIGKRSSAIATCAGTSGKGFQTDGEVTAARYGGHLQGRFDSLDESYLSRSVPSALMGGFLNTYGDSGEDSPGGGNGSRTARTARERDREVYVETVEDLEALEGAEQWEMPGLEERGSGQDLTWQQSLFSSPGAMLPRVGSAGGGRTGGGGTSGMSKGKREKGVKGSGAKYPSSDLEGQQDSPRHSSSERRNQYHKGVAERDESRDNFYPLPAIPPYRDTSSYNTPKKSASAGSRKRTTLDDPSSRPAFAKHTVSAPAVPAIGASGKKNKQVEALIGMYAGPTFHNSPSPDALPAPRLRGH